MAILRKLILAALGLLAYQNREKIGNMLRGNKQRGGPGHPPEALIDELTKGSTALGYILDRFREAGSGEKVESWIRQGANQPIQPNEVETAIDVGTLAALSRQTGLSREDLIGRITQRLPKAVDAITPDGVWPEALSGENLRDLHPQRAQAETARPPDSSPESWRRWRAPAKPVHGPPLRFLFRTGNRRYEGTLNLSSKRRSTWQPKTPTLG